MFKRIFLLSIGFLILGGVLFSTTLPTQWIQQRLILSNSNVKGISILLPKKASFYSNVMPFKLNVQIYKKGYVYVFAVLPNGKTYLIYPTITEMGRKVFGLLKISPINGNYRFGMNVNGMVLVEAILSARPIYTLDHLIKLPPNNKTITYMCDSTNYKKLYYNILRDLYLQNNVWYTDWIYLYVASPNTYSILEVNSTPRKARIYVDNVYKGFTPLVLRLLPGTHTVRLNARGYVDWIREIELPITQQKTVINATLLPSDQIKRTATLKLKTNVKVKTVRLNGKVFTVKNDEIKDLQPGDYTLQISVKGYEPLTRQIYLSPGTTFTLVVYLNRSKGNICIISEPFARVYVNNVFVGTTDFNGELSLTGVYTGLIRIYVEKDWYIRAGIEVSVMEGLNQYYIPLQRAGRIMVSSNVYPVEVLVDGVDYGEITDEHHWLYVPIGYHRIRFQHPEYEDYCKDEFIEFKRTSKLDVVMKELPLRIEDVSISPNPFSPNNDWYEDTTNVSFTLTKTASVTLSIWQGNELVYSRTSTERYGRHSWGWTGEDNEGRIVRDGKYMVRLSASRGKESVSLQREIFVDTSHYTYTKEITLGALIAALIASILLMLNQ